MSKILDLKSVSKKSGGNAVRSSKAWKSEKAYIEEFSNGDYDGEKMAFIIKMF